MIGGTMIKICEHEIFVKNMSTLQETSKDAHNGEYMTTSQIKVINFDNVKDEYYKKLDIKDTPMSIDALYIREDEKIIFIEFKNGYINQTEQFNLKRKIYDSVLIFSGIVGMNLQTMRNKVDYVLVINENKNREEKEKMASYVQPSGTYNKGVNYVGKRANKKYSPYGLSKRFENFCFKNVDVFNKNDFEKYIDNCFI